MPWPLILVALAAAPDAQGSKADKKAEFHDIIVLRDKLADGSFMRIRDCKVVETKDEYIVSFPKTLKGLETHYPREQVVEVIRPAAAVAKRTDPPEVKVPVETKTTPPDMTPAGTEPPAVTKSAPPEAKADAKVETPETRPAPKAAPTERVLSRPAAAEAPEWWTDPDTRTKIRYGSLAAVIVGLLIAALAARSGR